jgi:hypothetical protein
VLEHLTAWPADHWRILLRAEDGGGPGVPAAAAKYGLPGQCDNGGGPTN